MVPVNTYIFKNTAFCNLNCSYCYIFNLGDNSYRGRPKVMPLETVELSARRMLEQARQQGVGRLNIAFHGGEPLLAGREWVRQAVDCFRRVGGDELEFTFGLQTNGVLMDEEWIELLDELRIGVSVSLDGPRHINDRARVNFAGRGSYDAVVRGLRLMLDSQAGRRIFGGVLCVIDPDTNGLEIYHHFRELGVEWMDFLLPLDHNWDNPPKGHLDPGATPYADYLIPIFDDWWAEDNENIQIRYFKTILGYLFGSKRGVDSLGGNPISFAIIDTDGALEPLDSLRACGDGFTNLGLNIRTDPILSLYEQTIFQIGLAGQEGLSDVCKVCPLHDTCGAGYLPHRYSLSKAFKNQSVYCRDLWKLINHMLDAAVQRINPAVPLADGNQPLSVQPVA
jgi:uncharacterized protein